MRTSPALQRVCSPLNKDTAGDLDIISNQYGNPVRGGERTFANKKVENRVASRSVRASYTARLRLDSRTRIGKSITYVSPSPRRTAEEV